MGRSDVVPPENQLSAATKCSDVLRDLSPGQRVRPGVMFLSFEIPSFEFVSDFEFRISNFPNRGAFKSLENQLSAATNCSDGPKY